MLVLDVACSKSIHPGNSDCHLFLVCERKTAAKEKLGQRDGKGASPERHMECHLLTLV